MGQWMGNVQTSFDMPYFPYYDACNTLKLLVKQSQSGLFFGSSAGSIYELIFTSISY
jgi:hypothetical protein